MNFDEDEDGNVVATFYVDDKAVLAEVINFCDPRMLNADNGSCYYIDAAELFGLLRSSTFRQIYLTVSDPIYIVVDFMDDWDAPGYYQISFSEYSRFQQYFCTFDSQDKGKPNWLKEGF